MIFMSWSHDSEDFANLHLQLYRACPVLMRRWRRWWWWHFLWPSGRESRRRCGENWDGIIHHIILAPSIVCILYPLPTYSLSSHLSILPSYCTMWPRCEKYCPNTRHAISPSMHLSKIFIHIDIDVKRQMICVWRGNHCLRILLLMMLAFDINTTLRKMHWDLWTFIQTL